MGFDRTVACKRGRFSQVLRNVSAQFRVVSRSCRAAQILTIPFATAHKPICSLFSAPVFSLMCWTCLATVLDEIRSTRAMALFVSPSNAITCTSLGVSLYCWASWQTGQDMIVQLSGVCSPVLHWRLALFPAKATKIFPASLCCLGSVSKDTEGTSLLLLGLRR
jgi:hypothetical protein